MTSFLAAYECVKYHLKEFISALKLALDSLGLSTKERLVDKTVKK